MTVDKQPRALYLADVLAAGFECDQEWYEIESAKELRRLHAENVDFRATIDHLTRENAGQIGEIAVLKEQRDELLKALKEVSEVFDVSWRNGSTQRRLGDLARAAIAKATGETK